MKREEVVSYIQHYLDKDISKGAIMLTGAWGTGKSYFIQEYLLEALKRDNENRCVVVSLYGLKSVEEISKCIFFELRAGFLKSKNEAVTTSLLAAKTVVRGVTSLFGVDLKASDEDMLKLYKSVDLKNKLIVLEDLERCQIDIIEVLGFVNNLVDQDGVKVLLVANENEFLHYETVEEDKLDIYGIKSEKVLVKRPTKETEYYLKIKEKTVNDTIVFEGDFFGAIKSIIIQFDNKYLSLFVDDINIEDIYSIMILCRSFNLRSFIYACQKTVDIFEKIPADYLNDSKFLKDIYYGIIFFVLRIKSGRELKWGDEKYFSIDLGSEATPLFKFCYEYIMEQTCDLTQIEDIYKSWQEKNRYNEHKSNADNDINIICNYHIHSEEEIIAAVNRLSERLSNPDDLSFYMYGTIAVYLISIKHLLGCDITDAKKRLVANLKGRGDKLQLEYIFRTVMREDENEDVLNEYQSLRKEMANALKTGTLGIENFSYLPEQTKDFCDYINDNEGRLLNNHSFAGALDIIKMAKMFEECSLEQKNDIRGVFLRVYRSANIADFLRDDLESIEELKFHINQAAELCKGDKIEKLQYEFFLSNLSDIIQKLE